ncbi:MAG TPA: hypothetical protein VIM79_28270 [Niastella sp.]
MRNELELISTIEKYLNNGLSAEEKTAFEKELSADPQLQEAVALQREVMQGITNLSLKQNIQLARKKYYRIRNFTKWGLASLIVTAVVVVLLVYLGRKSNNSLSLGLPEYNELHQKQWADADKRLAPQKFLINTDRDTIVETKSGMVVQIPANGFLTENKQPVKGQIELTVKEANDAAGIMRAGLSSTSGDQLLESAGMFLLDVRQNQKILSINPTAGLYIELPADTIQPGMKLFKGKRLADGRIDWVDPQPLEHDLTPVNINTLNFYPPRYLDSLAKWGYNITDKKFTDSLYYSFADWFLEPMPEGYYKHEYIDDSGTQFSWVGNVKCAINPAKIKAIWNEQFQNTLLATREFEERIRFIHETHYDHILDLYINNLDKKLYEIDSMAASIGGEGHYKQFEVFAARRDGAVKLNSTQSQQLRKYYESKTQTFMAAVAKTNHEFWEKQARLNEEAANKHTEHYNDSLNNSTRRFEEELALNLKSAYKQLGYDTSGTPRLPAANVYRAQITATGWYNVDKYVTEATTDRTTLNYIDSSNGKTATIKYEAVSFQINKPEQYDDLYVYLLPDKLNSFMRLMPANGQYTEKLNELITYKLICIGYKGDRAFFYSLPAIEPKAYTNIELAEITTNELNRLLNQEKNRNHGAGVQKELVYYQFNKKDKIRQRNNANMKLLKHRISLVIFECLGKLLDEVFTSSY